MINVNVIDMNMINALVNVHLIIKIVNANISVILDAKTKMENVYMSPMFGLCQDGINRKHLVNLNNNNQISMMKSQKNLDNNSIRMMISHLIVKQDVQPLVGNQEINVQKKIQVYLNLLDPIMMIMKSKTYGIKELKFIRDFKIVN